MNILLIAILAIIILNILGGYHKGFLKTAFSLVSWIIVLIACNVVTPMVTEFLIEKTDIEITVQTVVDAKIDEMISGAIDGAGLSDVPTDLPLDLQSILPGGLTDLFSGMDGNMGNILAGENLLDTTGLVYGIIQMISLVIVIVGSRFAVFIISVVLGVASKLPLIGPLDKVLGLGCGVLKGFIWCWIVLAIVAVLSLTGVNTELAAYISQSQILTWLQENNVILNLIIK